jgi:hypothetical protein
MRAKSSKAQPIKLVMASPATVKSSRCAQALCLT